MKQETINDFLRETVTGCNGLQDSCKQSFQGNGAKMREVMAEIVLLTYKVGKSIKADVACGIIAAKAKSALSAPPRNCDVGTAEEQAERFLTFCTNHATFDGCGECPLYGSDRCEIAWTQMPYESEVK